MMFRKNLLNGSVNFIIITITLLISYSYGFAGKSPAVRFLNHNAIQELTDLNSENATVKIRGDHGNIITRRAYCSRSTVYTEFGNYSMISHAPEGTLMRTDWMDHRTGRTIGNCEECNAWQLNETFRMLCPIMFQDIFHGMEPI